MAVVAPVDPFERRIFDGLEATPWSAPVDDSDLKRPLMVSASAFYDGRLPLVGHDRSLDGAGGRMMQMLATDLAKQ